MGTTLDDYLSEIDSWKQPVSDKASNLSPEERAALDREARAWLEAKLGRALEGGSMDLGEENGPDIEKPQA